ncbi:MAG: PilZ domain-containing protein [Thermoanaerobaculia bacterium]|nr:PilZ domain-containing protein [Thermoanaerobaculia bacterium]
MQPIQSGPEQQVGERRFTPRVRVTYRVEMKSGTRRIIGHTTDVSNWGLFVETREMLEVGSKVRLSFAVGASAHDLVEAHGRVARRVRPEETATTGQRPGLGIEIHRFLWGHDRFLEAYERLLTEARGSAGSSLDKNRRRSQRAEVGLPIYWGDGSGKVDRAGFITNLSKSGAFFVEAPPLPSGTRLHLWFEVPLGGTPKRVEAVATVMRIVGGPDAGDGPRGMGVRLETSTLDSEILEEFLDDRLDDPERRAGIRRHRENFGTEIDELVLEALEELDRSPDEETGPGPEELERSQQGLRPGERRYRLVQVAEEDPTLNWAQVGSIAFKAIVTMALTLFGITLFEILALL